MDVLADLLEMEVCDQESMSPKSMLLREGWKAAQERVRELARLDGPETQELVQTYNYLLSNEVFMGRYVQSRDDNVEVSECGRMIAKLCLAEVCTGEHLNTCHSRTHIATCSWCKIIQCDIMMVEHGIIMIQTETIMMQTETIMIQTETIIIQTETIMIQNE